MSDAKTDGCEPFMDLTRFREQLAEQTANAMGQILFQTVQKDPLAAVRAIALFIQATAGAIECARSASDPCGVCDDCICKKQLNGGATLFEGLRMIDESDESDESERKDDGEN